MIIKMKMPEKARYEIEDTGKLKACTLLDIIFNNEHVTKKKDNVAKSLDNMLYDGYSVEKAYYDMLTNEVEIHLYNQPYKVCQKCGSGYNDYSSLSKIDNKSEICPICKLAEDMNYSNKNAQVILEKVEKRIDQLNNMNKNMKFNIKEVSNELNIFDYYIEEIGISKLKDMRKFLKEVIKLGYTGFVCFKINKGNFSSGMWAYKNESINGFAPDGEYLYKCFGDPHQYWLAGNDYERYKILKNNKMLEEYIKELNNNE